MRITYKVFLVGGIPIAIAAAIALAALMLLNEADRARTGAVLASTIYRNLLSASASRDGYLNTPRSERTHFYELFLTYAEQARFDLLRLSSYLTDPQTDGAATEAADALQHYRETMLNLVDVTGRNDSLTAEISERATSLLALTDQARASQRQSDDAIVKALAGEDSELRNEREIADRAHDLQAALAWPIEDAPAADAVGAAAGRLTQILKASALAPAADELADRLGAYERAAAPDAADARRALGEWAGALRDRHAARAVDLQEKITGLLAELTRSAEAAAAIQDLAVQALKLSNRATKALATSDAVEIAKIHAESGGVGGAMVATPVPAAIQSEMMQALQDWRGGLAAAVDGFNEQTRILKDMDATSRRMIEGARSLNESLTRNADRIGALVRNILIFGAAIGLLVGSLTGIAVARSITRPLRRLQSRMQELSESPRPGPIADFVTRRDELGDMARATNVFITEIGRREQALRKSKDRADSALAELQKTQTDLIQAEKLASLGQLVAGVAHEINTPLGIALTTATLLGEEANRFGEVAASGKLQRSVLERFVERMREGTELLFGNLSRAADLVHSFKQVAADQASGERRPFLVSAWLQDLLTSLRPMLRKAEHEVKIECPPDIMIDSYPGALGQVLTNLLANAVTHAYAPGEAGRLSIRVSEPRQDIVRIVFSDDGKGIPPENIGRVFDPFFTTGRTSGSTGLGLHIVYNLVTGRLQGHVDLYSRVGRGTRFTIDIPKTIADEAPAEASEKRHQMEGA